MNVKDLALDAEDHESLMEGIGAIMADIQGEPAAVAPTSTSPFKKAEKVERRLKLFLWGASGSGKTTLGLHFPKPAVLDFERGCELYGGTFDFDVLPCTTADEAIAGVDWLLTNQHENRTLVVDPVTIFWELIQRKWSDTYLKRNKGGKGHKHEWYEFQPKDWAPMKSELKGFIQKLLALDMHVICTARAKTLYEEGAFMRAAGETFDGEKSLPYLFDVVLRLSREGPKFMATTDKDRTGMLPAGTWEVSYERFEEIFGARSLGRKAVPIRLATQVQKDRVRELAKVLQLTDEKLAEGLQKYGAESLEELTKTNADVILEKLEAAAVKVQSVTVKETGNAV